MSEVKGVGEGEDSRALSIYDDCVSSWALRSAGSMTHLPFPLCILLSVTIY